MRRVHVIGTSGSGKSTLGARLARWLAVPHVELDSLRWQPGWVEVSDEAMRQQVALAAAGEAWVIDGNYNFTRDLVWARADTVVWLDYSRGVVMRRSIMRTLRRFVRREICCNGNRERLSSILSRDSIVIWAWSSYPRVRQSYTTAVPEFEAQGGAVHVFRTPLQTDQWMAVLEQRGREE